MLPVRVDTTGERVLLVVRVLVSGCDSHPQPAVHSEREHVGTVRAGDVGGGVRRAVVDHEHVDVREGLPELVEDRRKVLLLVQSRDEDDRVRHRP
jgi:hypothetical protein